MIELGQSKREREFRTYPPVHFIIPLSGNRFAFIISKCAPRDLFVWMAGAVQILIVHV